MARRKPAKNLRGKRPGRPSKAQIEKKNQFHERAKAASHRFPFDIQWDWDACGKGDEVRITDAEDENGDDYVVLVRFKGQHEMIINTTSRSKRRLKKAFYRSVAASCWLGLALTAVAFGSEQLAKLTGWQEDSAASIISSIFLTSATLLPWSRIGPRTKWERIHIP